MQLTKYYLFLIFFSGIVLFTSCTTRIDRNITGSPYNANFRVELYRDDFEFVTNLEGKISFTTYLGIFNIYTGSGNDYNSNIERRFLTFKGKGSFMDLNKWHRRALYEAHKNNPEVDFIVPVLIEREKQPMFLSAKKTYRIKAKGYKIK